ncbi:MAG: hypothetical protein ACOH2V_11850 [Candidatus Saccharimonadaceae bacterium]
MIKNLKYAIIADIGIFNPIFYDEHKKEDLVRMCIDNGITYLPNRSRKSAYKLVNNQFVETKIEEHLKVNPYDRLFDQETINKFVKVNPNELRFIMERDEIIGVVHIVDYNNDFIDVELFKALLEFETNLRKLFIYKGLTNNSFITWVRERPESNMEGHHWHKRLYQIQNQREEQENANPFQTFYLRELLEFAESEKLIDLYNSEIEEINQLRNLLAHNKDVISHSNKKGSIIYNSERLQDFANQMKVFFYAFDILAQGVDNQKAAVQF